MQSNQTYLILLAEKKQRQRDSLVADLARTALMFKTLHRFGQLLDGRQDLLEFQSLIKAQ